MMNNRLWSNLYWILLKLFPRGFSSIFGEEMVCVFEAVLEEADRKGRVAILWAVLRELGCLPLEALRLHLSGDKSLPGLRSTGWEGPPTRKEGLLMLGLFALPILGLFYQHAVFFSARRLVYLACGVVLGVVLVGFLKGFPRWSLPYLGLVLATASFVLIMECGADTLSPQVMEKLGFLPQTADARLVIEVLWSGMLWLGLFALTGMVLGLLALLKRCQVLLQRIRQDWTLVSYILYSGVLAALGLSFSRHFAKNIYAVASIACLALGAWLFLRSPRAWQRLLALLGGLTLAVSMAAAGQWPLHPLDTWESAVWLGSIGSSSLLPVLEWGWIVIFLLAPGVLHLHPRRRGSTPAIP
jgi:hypothetical protein